ncbi:Gluconate kinase (GntK) (PDB:1KO4) [Commensalibacter communis]|uniref:Gluconokinase n=1 Tax=Commensalibacter communis TaxID=2972786 RepID=A0A9W4TNS1_9PROT|nr:gluconokinase [Commensalibacter communis]CAI3936476.1 Gluconate kinase (GntK) (PDB:1KO4) [Commensalibacter communis]CAI3942873.1 Gluconate kinase (GntK) (PDB:1KO4) [Commensalibacter communis]CAI3942877.1 Gluconate kinase (GntK) (PDB:1KO4) [Commensalibacter communis]CAI3943823.1 Gluconate kinase (GntK) (PDB:1KO4) [Commensalibacter communis]CAI3946952.1 Gluconate kinase (GntK) (PDB:1KO4) [Commensalibacter communis]
MNHPIADVSLIKPCLLVIMGVSGCGKSKLAKGLQQQLNWPFQEGDSLHSAQNIQKMSEGIPLTDEDRLPWLEKCHDWLKEREVSGDGCGILTCSALKKSYRDILRKDIRGSFYFIYIDVPQDILLQRLQKRKGHFMPASLLSSQLETLDTPDADENFIKITVRNDPFEEVLQKVLLQLQHISLKS